MSGLIKVAKCFMSMLDLLNEFETEFEEVCIDGKCYHNVRIRYNAHWTDDDNAEIDGIVSAVGYDGETEVDLKTEVESSSQLLDRLEKAALKNMGI